MPLVPLALWQEWVLRGLFFRLFFWPCLLEPLPRIDYSEQFRSFPSLPWFALCLSSSSACYDMHS